MKKLILISLLCLGPVALYSADYNPPANPSTENSDIFPFDKSDVVDIADIFPDWTESQLPSQENNLTATASPTTCCQLPEPGNPSSAKRKKDDTTAAPMGLSTQWYAGINPQSQPQASATRPDTPDFSEGAQEALGTVQQRSVGQGYTLPASAVLTTASAALPEWWADQAQLSTLPASHDQGEYASALPNTDPTQLCVSLREALDRTFFQKRKDGKGYCSRDNHGCKLTRKAQKLAEENWQAHCISFHVSMTDRAIIDSKMEAAGCTGTNRPTYRCKLCITKPKVAGRMRAHIVTQHILK